MTHTQYPYPQHKEGFLQQEGTGFLQTVLTTPHTDLLKKVPSCLIDICATVNTIQLMRKWDMSRDQALEFFDDWDNHIPWKDKGMECLWGCSDFPIPTQLDGLAQSQLEKRDQGLYALEKALKNQVEKLGYYELEDYLLAYVQFAMEELKASWDNSRVYFLAPLFATAETTETQLPHNSSPSQWDFYPEAPELTVDLFSSDEELDACFGTATSSQEDTLLIDDLFPNEEIDWLGELDWDDEAEESLVEFDFDWDEVEDDEEEEGSLLKLDWDEEEDLELAEELAEKRRRKETMESIVASFAEDCAKRMQAARYQEIFQVVLEVTGTEPEDVKQKLKELYPEDYEAMKEALGWK